MRSIYEHGVALYLLSWGRGYCLGAKNDQTHTALHSAVVVDQTDIVRILLETGADIECRIRIRNHRFTGLRFTVIMER